MLLKHKNHKSKLQTFSMLSSDKGFDLLFIMRAATGNVD